MKDADLIRQLIQEENYTEALTLLKPQLKTSVDVIGIHSLIAQCHYRLGQFKESISTLNEAITLAPAHAQLYSDRGVTFLMLNERSASLEDFDKAQELEPQNPYRYSSRAYVKDAFGDTKGAIDDYRQALALDPKDSISYNNLGLLLEKVGYQKEAQQLYAKADELEGRPPANPQPTQEQAIASKDSSATRPVKPPAQKQRLTATYFISTLKRIFTSREGFQEFLQHWLGGKSGR